MTETLQQFYDNVGASVTEGKRAERRLVDRLKEKTPEELARLPRELLDDLSDDDYRAVVAHVAPDHELKEPRSQEERKRRRRRFRDMWTRLPLALRAIVTGGVLGSGILVIGLSLPSTLDWWHSLTPPVRSTDTLTWPSCERLNGSVDGCTYRMTHDAAWNAVARQLDLPPSYLRLLNRHIDSHAIPSGSILVVWRERASFDGGR